MYLLSTEESNNKLNRSTFYDYAARSATSLCLCYWPPPPSAVARAQIILGLHAQSGDPSFVQQNPRMVRIRNLHITYTSLY